MPFLLHPVVILIFSQLIFTATDLLGRYMMKSPATFTQNLFKPWLIAFIIGHIIASIGQLYIFSKFEVGKTVALFGAVSIMLATILGVLFLQEVLSPYAYAGVSAASIAFLVLVMK